MRSFLFPLCLALSLQPGLLASTVNVSPSGSQAMAAARWHCSLDGKIYQVQLSDRELTITPVGSGDFSAALKIRTGKKGKQKVLGQWQANSGRGFVLLQQVSESHLSGYMLVPVTSDDATLCGSRTAAVLANLGGASENKISCRSVQVAWDRDDTATFAQATEKEPQGSFNLIPAASFVATQQADNSSLVGTWVSEDAGSVHYTHIEIELRADGSYTKTLAARTPGWGGGGQVGAPSLGGTHRGTWTSTGMVVHLSGDGNWPPYSHDLRSFRKIR